jgi:hypothetical protein
MLNLFFLGCLSHLFKKRICQMDYRNEKIDQIVRKASIVYSKMIKKTQFSRNPEQKLSIVSARIRVDLLIFLCQQSVFFSDKIRFWFEFLKFLTKSAYVFKARNLSETFWENRQNGILTITFLTKKGHFRYNLYNIKLKIFTYYVGSINFSHNLHLTF